MPHVKPSRHTQQFRGPRAPRGTSHPPPEKKTEAARRPQASTGATVFNRCVVVQQAELPRSSSVVMGQLHEAQDAFRYSMHLEVLSRKNNDDPQAAQLAAGQSEAWLQRIDLLRAELVAANATAAPLHIAPASARLDELEQGAQLIVAQDKTLRLLAQGIGRKQPGAQQYLIQTSAITGARAGAVSLAAVPPPSADLAVPVGQLLDIQARRRQLAADYASLQKQAARLQASLETRDQPQRTAVQTDSPVMPTLPKPAR